MTLKSKCTAWALALIAALVLISGEASAQGAKMIQIAGANRTAMVTVAVGKSQDVRTDRGFLCLPEADLRLNLQPGMTALIAARLPKQTAHEAIVTARRWGADDAVARGIVDTTATEAELLPRAIAIARERAAKDPATVAALKRGLYAETLRLLETEAGVAR